MAKKKKRFYEEMEFDDVQYAVDIVNGYKHKLRKVERGLYVAIITSAFNVFILWAESQGISVSAEMSGIFSLVMIGGAIVSYVLGGGILTALRWAWRIGAFMWYIFVFPLDLMMVIMGFGFSLVAFLCVPVIFVYMNYRQVKMDYKAAKKYISYYKVKTQPIQQKVSSSQTRSQANGSTVGMRNTANRSYGSTARTQTSESGTSTNRMIVNKDGTRSYR